MRLLLGIMWCLHFLPLPVLGRIGAFLGSVFYWVLPARRHITLTNLGLCFPELTGQERKAIALQHFKMYARSILERSILWWGSEQRVSKLIQIDSEVALDQLAAGPVILLCPHFVYLEIVGIGLALKTSFRSICSVYTPQKSALFDQALKNGRNRFGTGSRSSRLFSRSQGIKPIIRAMRAGYAFLMLPDMDFGIKDAEFIPFFGIPAATLTAPARLAASTNAKVIPVIGTALPNYQGWRITVHAPWENFPGNDIVAATRYMNTFLEARIRLNPPEYFWSHRRFKTRPPGEVDLYQ